MASYQYSNHPHEESRDEHDAYRLAVENTLQDDNRTAVGQVKFIVWSKFELQVAYFNLL